MKKPPKMDLASTLHVGLLVALVLLFFVVSSSPLLGTLGFESANLFVTLSGPIFCLVAALNRKQSFLPILHRELTWFSVTVALYGALLFVNGFYQTSCSRGAGLFPFLVIAVPALLPERKLWRNRVSFL